MASAAPSAPGTGTASPREWRVYLRPHRGGRVTLTADVRSSNYMGLQNFALLLDDVRVR